MRDDFAVFILTHGRPDNVVTYKSIIDAGYTGRVYLVVDDKDATLPAYRERFGDRVLVFSKDEVAKTFDAMDNFDDRRCVVYARNACFNLARLVGVRYFVQLDDDYGSWFYRYDYENRPVNLRMRRTMDGLWSALVEFLASSGCMTVAISQGGDHIGGHTKRLLFRRKAMNSFVCDVERPFSFVGRLNEDVNTYVSNGRRGGLLFTTMRAQLNQLQTQSNSAGMTEMYLSVGTYSKSFYSVMIEPSCVRISTLGDPRSPHVRVHHAINWRACTPKIVSESVRRAG